MTQEAALAALRAAWGDAAYWFTPEEVHLIGAHCGHSVYGDAGVQLDLDILAVETKGRKAGGRRGGLHHSRWTGVRLAVIIGCKVVIW